jgi:hypothetical protein
MNIPATNLELFQTVPAGTGLHLTEEGQGCRWNPWPGFVQPGGPMALGYINGWNGGVLAFDKKGNLDPKDAGYPLGPETMVWFDGFSRVMVKPNLNWLTGQRVSGPNDPVPSFTFAVFPTVQ